MHFAPLRDSAPETAPTVWFRVLGFFSFLCRPILPPNAPKESSCLGARAALHHVHGLLLAIQAGSTATVPEGVVLIHGDTSLQTMRTASMQLTVAVVVQCGLEWRHRIRPQALNKSNSKAHHHAKSLALNAGVAKP